MKRSVRVAAVAALASFGMAVTGAGALSVFDDESDVPNNVIGAGLLTLDVSESGSSTGMSMAGLHPGAGARQMVWATNDLHSTVPATVSFTVDRLVDTAAPCDTDRAKAIGEIVSGIAGCSLGPRGATGTPAVGVASRLIEIDESYVPTAQSAGSCEGAANSVATSRTRGAATSLFTAAGAHSTGGSHVLTGADGKPVVLAPGSGICVAVDVFWPVNSNRPGDASPSAPVDDAAQGDSVTADFTFELEQVSV